MTLVKQFVNFTQMEGAIKTMSADFYTPGSAENLTSLEINGAMQRDALEIVDFSTRTHVFHCNSPTFMFSTGKDTFIAHI